MSALTTFRDHCAAMAERDHKPECASLPENQPYWSAWSMYGGASGFEGLAWNGPKPKPPTCDGCNSADDRALFARMASEVDAYLAGDDEPLWESA